MAKNKIGTNWKEDFRAFLSVGATRVPSSLEEKVLGDIEKQINPSIMKVFSKALSVHFLISLLTFFFCPQFAFSLVSYFDLSSYLMKFGHTVCMIGCGAVFTGFSFATMSILLKPEEIRVLREHTAFYLLSLSGLSLGAFICFGADIVLGVGATWLLGATLGGYLMLEFGWKTRKLLILRRATV
jgi:hypothetical protein